MEKSKKDHIQKAYDRIPPSMKYRESIIVDPTKEIPEAIKQIDIKKKLAKQRYEIRYQLEKDLFVRKTIILTPNSSSYLEKRL